MNIKIENVDVFDKFPNTQCDLLPRCGAAVLSELPYKKQVLQKIKFLKQTFSNLKDFDSINAIFYASPMPYFYRNRMDYTVSFKGEFGLREKGKWWRVLDNHSCIIAAKSIRKAFDIAYKWVKSTKIPYYDRKYHTGILKYIVFKTNKKGDILANIITTPLQKDTEDLVFSQARILGQKLAKAFDTDVSVVLSSTPLKSDASIGSVYKVILGQDSIFEEVNGYVYKIPANAFFQANMYGHKLLQDLVISLATDNTKLTTGTKKELLRDASKSNNFSNNKDLVFDLYSGSGFFTLPLSKYFKKVIAVEEFKESIENGKENLSINKINNVEFVLSRVEDAIDKYTDRIKESVVVLDPPRSGLHPKVLQALMQNVPERIVYVSCNYKKFIEEYDGYLSGKYKVSSINFVDMFANTNHLESVILLETK